MNNQLVRRNNARRGFSPQMTSTLMKLAVRYGLPPVKGYLNKAWNLFQAEKKLPVNVPRLTQTRSSRPTGRGGGAPMAYSGRQNARLGQKGSHRVVGSELLATVNGSINYSALKFQLNPGLAGTFPRLSKEAAVWQLYSFSKLVFRFVTRTGTGAVGSVILSPSYNPAEPAPADEKEASNTEGAIEDVTWSKEIACRLKRANMFPLGPKKQLRYNAVPGDYNIYDCGNLYFCTVGQVDASAIGKLWVDYEVDFYIPQSIPIAPHYRTVSVFKLTTINNSAFAATGVSPLTFTQAVGDNPLDITLDATGQIITFPQGAYTVNLVLDIFTDGAAADVYTADLDLEISGATSVFRHKFGLCTAAATGFCQIAFISSFLVEEVTETSRMLLTLNTSVGVATKYVDNCRVIFENV